MAAKRKWVNVIGITGLIVIPVLLVFFLARANWVHKELPFLGQTELDDSGKEVQHTVSNFHFTDHHGLPVNLDSFQGKIIVANIFFSTCPEVCPEMNNQVQVIAEEFSRFEQIRFLSVSIDPMNDSVAALAAYAQRFNNRRLPHWRFCTGSKAEIYDWVTNDLLLANQMKGADFIHDDKVVIIDKERHIRAILPTRPPEGTPANKILSVRLELVKNIKDDIDNLLYEYRQKELDK